MANLKHHQHQLVQQLRRSPTANHKPRQPRKSLMVSHKLPLLLANQLLWLHARATTTSKSHLKVVSSRTAKAELDISPPTTSSSLMAHLRLELSTPLDSQYAVTDRWHLVARPLSTNACLVTSTTCTTETGPHNVTLSPSTLSTSSTVIKSELLYIQSHDINIVYQRDVASLRAHEAYAHPPSSTFMKG